MNLQSCPKHFMPCAGKQKVRRAEHKFHKKPARSKGTRGKDMDRGDYDGAAIKCGKRGGLVRVAVSCPKQQD